MQTNFSPCNKEGQRHGLWEIYFDNGQLDCKGEFVNGVANGLHESYWEDGSIFSMGIYDLGKKIGFWKISPINWGDAKIVEKIFYGN